MKKTYFRIGQKVDVVGERAGVQLDKATKFSSIVRGGEVEC